MEKLEKLEVSTISWESSKKDIALNILKKMIKVEEINNKEMEYFNIEDIKQALMLDKKDIYLTESYGYMQTVLGIIREIYKIFEVKKEIKTEDFSDLIDKKYSGFYTIDEIQDICNLFINPQDKLIVYGLFSGFNLKDETELLELKVEDINFNNKTIQTKHKIIRMDDFLEEIIIDATDKRYSNIYYTNKDEKVNDTRRNSYDLNIHNRYVIKPKPSTKNDGGLGAMKITGLRTRLTRLSKMSGFNLLSNKLIRSGIIYRMNQFKKDWNTKEIMSYLKIHNIQVQPHELLRVYNYKYGK